MKSWSQPNRCCRKLPYSASSCQKRSPRPPARMPAYLTLDKRVLVNALLAFLLVYIICATARRPPLQLCLDGRFALCAWTLGFSKTHVEITTPNGESWFGLTYPKGAVHHWPFLPKRMWVTPDPDRV